MKGFKAGGIAIVVAIILFFLTPFFPFDELIAIAFGAIAITSEFMK